MKQYKSLHSLELYGKMVKGYPYIEPFDDETLADLADESKDRNIPNAFPLTVMTMKNI